MSQLKEIVKDIKKIARFGPPAASGGGQSFVPADKSTNAIKQMQRTILIFAQSVSISHQQRTSILSPQQHQEPNTINKGFASFISGQYLQENSDIGQEMELAPTAPGAPGASSNAASTIERAVQAIKLLIPVPNGKWDNKTSAALFNVFAITSAYKNFQEASGLRTSVSINQLDDFKDKISIDPDALKDVDINEKIAYIEEIAASILTFAEFIIDVNKLVSNKQYAGYINGERSLANYAPQQAGSEKVQDGRSILYKNNINVNSPNFNDIMLPGVKLGNVAGQQIDQDKDVVFLKDLVDMDSLKNYMNRLGLDTTNNETIKEVISTLNGAINGQYGKGLGL